MRLLGLICGLALTATSVGAAAQNDLTQKMNPREAERVLAIFADCMAGRAKAQTNLSTFLRTVPGSEGFYSASMKAADLTCLNDEASIRRSKLEMRMQPATFRDAAFPALYRRDFKKSGPPAAIAAMPPLDLAREFDGDLAALPAEYRPGRALGDCVARAAPLATHTFLMARPYDKHEDAAVIGLKPAVAGCLNAGQTARLSRSALRAYLGEAMYKLSTAARAGTSNAAG